MNKGEKVIEDLIWLLKAREGYIEAVNVVDKNWRDNLEVDQALERYTEASKQLAEHFNSSP